MDDKNLKKTPKINNSSDVVVKKVPAYPIAAQLKMNTAVGKAGLVKLTQLGFLAEVDITNLIPGDKCDIEFTIPVLGHHIAEPIVVIKQYTRMNDSKTMAHLIEAHFTNLSSTSKAKIKDFMRATGAIE
jgi:hypothetical protein